MGKMSKRKGASGEREAAAKLNELFGTSMHRGRQYHGGPDSPDITGDLDRLHIEVKRTERLQLYKALEQAEEDAAEDQIPVLLHRRNRGKWILAFELDRVLDFVEFISSLKEDASDA